MSVAVERCDDCGAGSLEQRSFCAACGSRRVAVQQEQGDGVVWSITRIHRPPAAADADSGPYDVALVTLRAGPRLMLRAPDGLRIGMAVIVHKPDLDDPAAAVERLLDEGQASDA